MPNNLDRMYSLGFTLAEAAAVCRRYENDYVGLDRYLTLLETIDEHNRELPRED